MGVEACANLSPFHDAKATGSNSWTKRSKSVSSSRSARNWVKRNQKVDAMLIHLPCASSDKLSNMLLFNRFKSSFKTSTSRWPSSLCTRPDQGRLQVVMIPCSSSQSISPTLAERQGQRDFHTLRLETSKHRSYQLWA